MGKDSKFSNKGYDCVKSIPKGKVTTYGIIAALSGNPNASRAVGQILHNNPSPVKIPCHRVVNRDGRLAPSFAFGGQDIQKILLERENIHVDINNRVNLKKYGWKL